MVFSIVWLAMILLFAGAITGAVFALYYNNRLAEIFAGLGFAVCSGLLFYLYIPDSSIRCEVQKVIAKPEAPVLGTHYEVQAGVLKVKQLLPGCQLAGKLGDEKKSILEIGKDYALTPGVHVDLWFQNDTDPPTSTIVPVIIP